MAEALQRAQQWRADHANARQHNSGTPAAATLRNPTLSEWLELARQGNAVAQEHLCLIYHQGDGVRQDFREALRWFRLAADQGNTDAQTSLGLMYEDGEGVPKDYVQAHMWYNLASAGGDASAKRFRDAIEALMTLPQIAQAQALARAWKPRLDSP